MQLIVHSQNVEITPAIREYLEKKLNKLSRYFDHIGEIQVHASVQRNFKIAEVTVNANGHLVRAEERSPDLHASIDQVVNKLEKQLKHYKERMIDRQRRPPRQQLGGSERSAGITGEAGHPEEDSHEEPVIVRRKRFDLEMMSAEDAAERMQMLGHDFFMFLNDETQQVNVVYERQDGRFGVLEPNA